jgi:hypothetical protein
MSGADPQAEHDALMRERLPRMSGQIADFFRHLPAEDAANETARHINLYWSRSMRRDLARLFEPDAPELHPLVRDAWKLFRFPKGARL